MLYTALTHAREPASVQQLLYFMYYILENYGVDDEITDIVDNTELYFVPCVNPDGYVYNQMESPQGGGMWRKNRRNNGDGSFGVDLNRNFGYKWGGTTEWDHHLFHQVIPLEETLLFLNLKQNS